MRILVAIANHGTKNKIHLDRLLAAYDAMSHEVDVVLLSDRPNEDVPTGIEVRVGAPTDNPWSLPFGHRPLFAEKINDYDLFIYTEDDTLIEQRHVDAFLEVNELLPENLIPGFMRYEIFPSGERSYCSVHSHFRWDPESVELINGETFAAFSNAHSACYMLTRQQLAAAIRSGGFVVAPHAGIYDMLVSAATDPYTRCGFEKRICISRVEDFLLHHLPNAYLGRLGIDARDFTVQLNALCRISKGGLSRHVLANPTTLLETSAWDMHCYPSAFPELGAALSRSTGPVLSIGSTSGQLERDLFGGDRAVTAVPLDDVLGSMARARGIRTTSPRLECALQELRGEQFPLILMYDVLHRFEDPVACLVSIRQLMTNDGRLVLTAPNLTHARLRQALGRARVPIPSGFERSGLHPTDGRAIRRWLHTAGFVMEEVRYRAKQRDGTINRRVPAVLRSLQAGTLVVTGHLQRRFDVEHGT